MLIATFQAEFEAFTANMSTFSELAPFLDWFLRLIITLAAIAGLVKKLLDRIFNQYFNKAIKPVILEMDKKLDSIGDKVDNHEHQVITKRKKLWF